MSESDDRTVSGAEPQRISVSKHEKNLRKLRCIVTEMFPVTLHHCHGGSMIYLGEGNPGMGEKNNPFYQIPLMMEYHVGQRGIDGSMGVDGWEALYGRQVDLLGEVNEQLDYNLWEQAKLWSKENWKSATPVGSHLS